MSLNSVDTDMGAMALQSVKSTQQQVAAGYRVAESTDGAAYAIAQSARSNVGALTSASPQLGNATQTALTNIPNTGFVDNRTTYNNARIEALNSGLGSLADADLAKESAQLTALQIRQQLGAQALSLANKAPQSLLSLFK